MSLLLPATVEMTRTSAVDIWARFSVIQYVTSTKLNTQGIN
jgi:hypothetical protein